MQLLMSWTPIRELTEWEKKCIARAEELFDIRWLQVDDYEMPELIYDKPQGPSEWMRWHELQMPNALWSDCDVYWYKVPNNVLGAQFLCDNRCWGIGHRPNDAVIWSGAHPEVAMHLCKEMETANKYRWTFKRLRTYLEHRIDEQGKTWAFFDEYERCYQHKERK